MQLSKTNWRLAAGRAIEEELGVMGEYNPKIRAKTTVLPLIESRVEDCQNVDLSFEASTKVTKFSSENHISPSSMQTDALSSKDMAAEVKGQKYNEVKMAFNNVGVGSGKKMKMVKRNH